MHTVVGVISSEGPGCDDEEEVEEERGGGRGGGGPWWRRRWRWDVAVVRTQPDTRMRRAIQTSLQLIGPLWFSAALYWA